MINQLRRAARKHAEKLPCQCDGDPVQNAFIEGAKWQAKQDMDVAVTISKEHLKGGFFALGVSIAKAIELSVDTRKG